MTVNQLFDTYRPEGFGTVSAYLITEQPKILIQFLKDAFYAELKHQSLHPETGNISNCIVKIGHSCFMISQANKPFTGMKTAFYLYVNDVDFLHSRALKYGAQAIFEPADMDYQDRQSGICDPCGNYWWISQRLVDKEYHE